jgi:hypothetical protein
MASDAQRRRQEAAARRRAAVREAGSQGQQQQQAPPPPPDPNIGRQIRNNNSPPPRQEGGQSQWPPPGSGEEEFQQARRRVEERQESNMPDPDSELQRELDAQAEIEEQFGGDLRENLEGVDRAGQVDEIEEAAEMAGRIVPREQAAGAIYNPRLLGSNSIRNTYSQFRDLAEVPGRRLIYANQMRSSTSLDPILKYYMSKNRAPLSIEAPDDPSKNDFHFRHGEITFTNQNGSRNLSFQNPGSINVHWSHGGFGYLQSIQGEEGMEIRGPLTPMPIGSIGQNALVKSWKDAVGPGDNTPSDDLNFQSVYLSGRSSFAPLLPEDTQAEFNFAQEITELARALDIERLPYQQEAEILRSVRYDDARVDRQLAAVGITRRDFEVDWLDIPANEMRDYRTNSTAFKVQQVIDDRLEQSDRRRNKAALTAYPDDTYFTLSENKKLEFEYFNFRAEAPYTVDYISIKSGLLDANLTRPDGVMSLGTIRSEFNSWQSSYMKAIQSPAIPEAVLPNLYIYDIVASDNNFPIQQGESWEGSAEVGDNLQTAYDELMTMNDFESRLIPSLSEDGLAQYLQMYATSVASSSLGVDFISNLRDQASVFTCAGSDFDIFGQANRKKSFFPIYIEFELPTSGKTEVSKLFEETYTSTSMINAFKETRHDVIPVHFQSSGIRCEGTDENPFSVDDAPIANYTKAFLNIRDAKVYDFSDWMANLEPLDGAEILERRPATMLTRTANELENVSSEAVTAINNYVQQRCEELKIDYKELLTLQHTQRAGFDPITSRTSYYCENETLMYKIEKYKYFSESSRTLLQTFYFPNSSFSNIIEYVDTQIKLDTLYEYEVTAYELVYGSKFIFRNRDFNDGISPDGENDFSPSEPVYFSFNVETEAAPKIIEYPLLSKRWRYAPSSVTRGNSQLITNNSLNGSLSYPPISVLDRPPVPPGVTILPYDKNATEVLFNFQISANEYVGENALQYYGLNTKEEEIMEDISRKQKVRPLVSPTLRSGFLEFETNNQEEIRRIEIYRVKNMDVDTTNLRTVYKKFNGNLHKVLDISEFGDEMFGRAKAFDFVDKLEPNQKYYYIFRAFDASGLFSNPSMIHVVELRNDSGIFTPIIQVLDLSVPEQRAPKKRMVRYLKISPSDLQKEPIVQESPEDGRMRETIGVVTDTSDRVESNDFVVRLTSTDTGRKIDLRLNFKQKITSDKKIAEATGNGRTQN